MKNLKIIEFDEIGKEGTGYLTAIESNISIPFGIKRVYYIYGVKNNISRGFHAHKKLEQILICISGSVKIKSTDGINEDMIELNTPTKGLYIGPFVWHEMYDFSDNAVLLVIASDYYDESDYIRNYSEFISYRKF